MRKRITKRAIDDLQPGKSISDVEVRGFRARCLRGGLVSYELRYGSGPARRFVKLGTHGNITPEQARALAKEHAGEAAAGKDPASRRREARAAAAHTLDTLLDDFLTRYVRKHEKELRSADEIERIFRAMVRPALGRRSIYDLRRRDITALLDKLEDENGPAAADKALAYLRRCFRWHAARDDRFVPPIVPGMARTKPAERARDRVHDDQEIRDINRALELATARDRSTGLLCTICSGFASLRTAPHRGRLNALGGDCGRPVDHTGRDATKLGAMLSYR